MRAFIIVALLLISVIPASAHPHPFVFIEGKYDEITLYALHVQEINLTYLQNNLVLKNCELENFRLDEAYLQSLEMLIIIDHSCEELKIEKNTLFQDYWKNAPLAYRITGFETEDAITIPSLESIIFQDNSTYTIPSNPFFLAAFLVLLGFVFSLMSELAVLILPISLHAKRKKDKWLWLKAGIIHLAVTYFVVLFAMNFFANEIIKYSGLIVILVGVSMLFEHRMHSYISPLILALIPDGAAFFFALVVFRENANLAYFSPLLMAIGEIILLKVGSVIPLPKKIIRYSPYVIIGAGILVALRYLI